MLDVRRFGIVSLLVAALAGTAAAQRVVFNYDPDAPGGAGDAGPEWSLRQMGRTPGGARFVGPFANEHVTLTLPNLPAHGTVRVVLTLYVVQSWDGSLFRGWKGSAFGPDIWSMDVLGEGGARRNLVRASFSNTPTEGGFKVVGALQSYPYPLTADRVTAGTGARERGTLGYVHPQAPEIKEDSVYQIGFLFPHDAPTLTLAFGGSGLSGGNKDEHWGIARVQIVTDAAATLPPAEIDELPALFDAACGIDDPFEAAVAFQRCAMAGDALVDHLAEHIEPAPAVDVALLREWVDALPKDGNEWGAVTNDFGQADAAEENLVRLGWAAEPHLGAILDAMAAGPARPRVARVVNRIRTTPSGLWSERQRLIALRLLAIIDTARARELRATLAPTK